MKVYLLNPPYIPHFGRGMRWQDTGRASTLYYPIWLSYATAIIEEDHEARLVDAPAWGWDRDQVIKDIGEFKPGLIVIDSSFPSMRNDISVAEEIKQNYPSTKIMLVGPPASQFHDKILESEGIDIVARWEYDFTVREIADALENNTNLVNIKGISFKNGDEITNNPDRPFSSSEDLDKIPFVSKVYKKHLNIKDYALGNALYPEVQLFTGRGCPFLCTFCSWPQTLMGRKYRVRNLSSVIDELEWIQKNMPEVKEVFLEDDTFPIEDSRVLAFCQEYKRRNLKITWSCNARVGLDYAIMKRMKEANCRLLIVGFESGSNDILGNIKKNTKVEQGIKFADDAHRAGLLFLADFIIGLPGETRETIQMTKQLIKRLRPDILQVSVASPFPGTEFYDWAKANGYLLTDNPDEYLDGQGHQKSIVNYPWLDSKEIVMTVDEILKKYYLSFSFAKIAARQVFRRNGTAEARRILSNARSYLRYALSRK